MYKVFVRNWWKVTEDPAWPNGLEPDPTATKYSLGQVPSEHEARALCHQYNSTHAPGRLSRKAEYEEVMQTQRTRALPQVKQTLLPDEIALNLLRRGCRP